MLWFVRFLACSEFLSIIWSLCKSFAFTGALVKSLTHPLTVSRKKVVFYYLKLDSDKLSHAIPYPLHGRSEHSVCIHCLHATSDFVDLDHFLSVMSAG